MKLFYTEVEEDLTARHHGNTVQILNEMLMRQEIDTSCYTYLVSNKIRTAQFCMLPKIHKNKTNPPGRPIVSGNGCPTERISSFVDFFLQPLIKDIPSYIKDSTHFLLNQLGIIPQGCTLSTLDVASLYTNIPNTEGIKAVDIMLARGRGNNPTPLNTSLF